jgi:hypothetical protein
MQQRPPQPTSIVFPLIGMLALGPGAIMHMFALGEATRLGSDWVYLSTPLLLVGAASFIWLLKLKLGTTGLGVGAVISLGAFVAAFVNLNATIVERVRWRDSSMALSDTDRFCRGDIKPNAAALPFDEKGKNPTVFFKGNSSIYESSLKPYEPEPYQIENAALVACVTEQTEHVQTCSGYTGGGVVDRERTDATLRVFSIKTGEKLFEKSFTGQTPRACANTEQFYGKSLHVTINGESPQIDLVAELGPLLKH